MWESVDEENIFCEEQTPFIPGEAEEHPPADLLGCGCMKREM